MRDAAIAGDSVTIVPGRDIDVSRGDVLSSHASPAPITREFTAEVYWLDQQPLDFLRQYLFKQDTHLTQARVQGVIARRNILALEHDAAQA